MAYGLIVAVGLSVPSLLIFRGSKFIEQLRGILTHLSIGCNGSRMIAHFGVIRKIYHVALIASVCAGNRWRLVKSSTDRCHKSYPYQSAPWLCTEYLLGKPNLLI